MVSEAIEAWRINQRINVRLIQRISDEGMFCSLSQRGGRNVVRQFAHLQYVRVYQLKRRAKALAVGAKAFESKEEPSRKALVTALNDSSKRIEKWIRLAHEGAPGVRTQKRGLIPTVAYLIAHESHHRGSIILTLKTCGHPLEKATRDAIWDWNRM